MPSITSATHGGSDLAPRSVFLEGRFGRMFRNIPGSFQRVNRTIPMFTSGQWPSGCSSPIRHQGANGPVGAALWPGCSSAS
jgi:hypothetical protein